MRKPRVRVPIERKVEIESRISSGESLRSVAKSLGVSHQALRYQRSMWGGCPIRSSDVTGSSHANWRGGVSVDIHGYRLIYSPTRLKSHPYTYEHVLIAEKKIGRRLKRGEHVHHINGNKLDNQPENLLVCTASEHRTLHRSLERLAMELVGRGEIEFNGTEYQWKS